MILGSVLCPFELRAERGRDRYTSGQRKIGATIPPEDNRRRVKALLVLNRDLLSWETTEPPCKYMCNKRSMCHVEHS